MENVLKYSDTCMNVSKGACRSCQISVKMLPITADIIASSFYNLYIFNLSVSNGVFVDDWKNAKVMER